MLEDLLSGSRPSPPPQRQQHSGSGPPSYGSASSRGASPGLGPSPGLYHGIASSVDIANDNTHNNHHYHHHHIPGGYSDFLDDDLHKSPVTVCAQLAAAFRYMARLKALMIVAVTLLAALCYVEDPLSADTLVHRPAVAASAFFLALVALLPCGAWAVEFTEDFVVSRDSERLGVLVNVVCEHLPAILFSLCALLWRENRRSLCWVKPLLLGCVLFQLLVVLGAAVLVAPESEERFGSSFGVSTWATFSSGLVFSCALFMIPTVYAVTITGPDLASVLQKKTLTREAALEEQASKLLLTSRGLSAAVILVYSVYLAMVFHSNMNYYTSAGNPNAPSTLSYALQAQDAARAVGPPFRQTVAAACAVVLFTLEALLCYIVARCLPAVVAAGVLPLPFILVVLLPLVFEGGGLGAAVLTSRAGRLDIGASIAFSGIVHLFMCVLPAVVLAAWALGAPLDLAFHPFLAVTCFIAVLLVAQMVVVNRVRWLEGAMLVGLYSLVGFVCLLGGWHLCYGTEKPKG